jgi:hypothetical protein
MALLLQHSLRTSLNANGRNRMLHAKWIARALICAPLLIGLHAEAKNCTKGKPCGDGCISQEDVCHVGETNATSGGAVGKWLRRHTGKKAEPAAERDTAAAATERSSRKHRKSMLPETAKDEPRMTRKSRSARADTSARHCKLGKSCGTSCIPKNAVCHL